MQPLVHRLTPLACQGVRNCSIQRLTVSPPLYRMSFAEKVAHGVVLTAGIFAVPTWILVHVKEYRGTS